MLRDLSAADVGGLDAELLLYHSSGVRLSMIDNAYLLEYFSNRCMNTPIFFTWPEAEANFQRRVEEAKLEL
jgi:hypothetical protein